MEWSLERLKHRCAITQPQAHGNCRGVSVLADVQVAPAQRLRRLTLEVTLKPFTDLSDAGLVRTCDRIWHDWRDLAERSDELAVLLWAGSGDELLTFTGDEDQPVPWVWDVGFSNIDRPGVYACDVEHYFRNRARPYRDSVPDIRYRDLRRAIAVLRETARARLGMELMVGAIVDPGPEFVESPWRYERHREVLQPKRDNLPYPMHFLTHECELDADSAPYVSFPQGIPAGTSFGCFLGRQFEAARRRLGFDYLWLSNGLGYSHHPWIFRGDGFDGVRFYPEEAAVHRERATRFWQDLRQQTDAPIEVRGTNFSVGMDLATDGCSHAELMAVGRMRLPPCNPPWGSRALGLEMVAYLSRLARTLDDRLPFRFYLNDPWFAAAPWYDYYGQEPFDIHVPMAAARVNDASGVDTPGDLSLLTIDTSEGRLLPDQAREFTTHLIAAADERPDRPGPVIWIYPFDEYDALAREQADRLGHVFAHDWAMCSAVQAGLPVNTVCSSDRFTALHEKGALPEAVYVAPAPVGDWAYAKALLRYVAEGGRAMLYGSTEHAPAELLATLGLTHAEPLEGALELSSTLAGDRLALPVAADLDVDPLAAAIGADAEMDERDPTRADACPPLVHRALISGGGVREVCRDASAVRVVVRQGEAARAYAVVQRRPEWRGGALAWLRSSVSFDPTRGRTDPQWDPPWRAANPGELARGLLGELGLQIVQDRLDASVRPTNVFIQRHRGAWIFVGCKTDTTARFRVRTPLGAPAYDEAETLIRDGFACENFGKSFRKSARVFVRMPDGIVRVKRMTVPLGQRCHFSITGLRDAEVAVLPDPEALAAGEVVLSRELAGEPISFETDPVGGAIRLRRFTGTLYVLW